MNIVQLMASPFVGGPERQVLGLARALRPRHQTMFLSFAERGLAKAFLDRTVADGFETATLHENAPHLFRAAAEIAEHLRRWRADVLCCSGYKPDLIGWLAARRCRCAGRVDCPRLDSGDLESVRQRNARSPGDARHGLHGMRLGGASNEGAPSLRAFESGSRHSQRGRDDVVR